MTTMQATLPTTASSTAKVWSGRIMGGIVILFMLMDTTFKFMTTEDVIKATTDLGFQAHHLPIMGTLGLLATLLYIIPRTEIICALLLTGYWGGAIATHVRMDNPLFTHIILPVYLGVLAWGALWIKNERLRQLILNRK